MATASSRKGKRKAQKFLAKDRKKLAESLKVEEYDDLIEEVYAEFYSNEFFQVHKTRFQPFMEQPRKALVIGLIKVMKAAYTDMFEAFCKGKKSLKFQTSWFLHVNLYFDKRTTVVPGLHPSRVKELRAAWTSLLQAASTSTSNEIPEERQRIVLVTLASRVSELIAGKIKERKKIDSSSAASSTPITCTLPASRSFQESKISLYRYCGFALHSVIGSYSSRTSANTRQKLSILDKLKCQQNELDEVPTEVQNGLRSSDRFTITSPKLLPYIQSLMTIIMATIGEEQLKMSGHEMIHKAEESKLLQNPTLIEEYKNCITAVQKCCDTPINSTIAEEIRLDISRKIFNSRIKEFFKAKTELELEASKKVVNCDQSLRDTLKTFSSIQSRH